jgi:hypothetical protein
VDFLPRLRLNAYIGFRILTVIKHDQYKKTISILRQLPILTLYRWWLDHGFNLTRSQVLNALLGMKYSCLANIKWPIRQTIEINLKGKINQRWLQSVIRSQDLIQLNLRAYIISIIYSKRRLIWQYLSPINLVLSPIQPSYSSLSSYLGSCVCINSILLKDPFSIVPSHPSTSLFLLWSFYDCDELNSILFWFALLLFTLLLLPCFLHFLNIRRNLTILLMLE